jgi:FkbM family methyltransferase
MYFNNPSQIQIYGAGGFGQIVARLAQQVGIEVSNFIDEKKSGELNGIRIVNISLINEDIPIFIGVCNLHGDLKEIKSNLTKISKGEIWSPVQAFKFFSTKGVEIEHYWLSTDFELYERESSNISNFRNLLNDDLSIKYFDQLIEYRNFGEIESLPAVSSISEQYLMLGIKKLPKKLHVLDCGAFEGEFVEYANQYGFKIKSYIGIEPDSHNYIKMVKNLEKHANLVAVALPMGVSHTTELVQFNSTGELGAAISEFGDSSIQVTSIDQLLSNSNVNFIKMDIEGIELDALKGAERTIRKNRPILAISVYHKPDHLWKIGTWINSLSLGYQFSIRNYGHQCFDTVLYAY